MQNKKTIMAFSAIFILIFHLWINLTNSTIEMYLRQLCVVGVDLFFFLSAYSIGKREKIDYKNFLRNRFCKIYLKFFVFSIIGAFYFSWDRLKFTKTILGIELFRKGGGSFLWFLPSIMFIYFTLPLYKKIETRYPKINPLFTILLYLFLSIMVSTFTTYKALFILTNRIPILLLGYYFAKYNVLQYLQDNKIKYWIITIILLLFGIGISYVVYIYHFKVTWFQDLFYILYIPLNIGLILLLDKIETNKLSTLLSSITLELYGLQMIFGFRLATQIYKLTNMKLISNLFTILILVIIAVIIKMVWTLIYKFKFNNKFYYFLH